MFSKRRRARGKAIDMAQVKSALRDGKAWTSLGVVRQFPGESSHFEIDGDDVLVDVELVPSNERVLCRLAAAGGGGFWTVPAVGEEVAVLVPEGDIEADPIILGTFSTPPGDVAVDRIIITRGEVKIVADHAVIESPNVELGGGNLVAAQAGVVLGECVDPFTGSTHFALGGASAIVKAKKV